MTDKIAVPGVTIKELSSGSHPITAAGTSTAAFLVTDAAGGKELLTYPADPNDDRTKSLNAKEKAAVKGFFDNGGSHCHLVARGEVSGATAVANLKMKNVQIIAVPDSALSTDKALLNALATHCKDMGDRMLILSSDQGAMTQEMEKDPLNGVGITGEFKEFTAFYHPWVKPVGAGTGLGGNKVPDTISPVGHIAGVWARVDGERGVFKAPANVALNGVTDVSLALAPDKVGTLNSVGVNCLRVMPGRGVVVWGARTAAAADTALADWKFLNVRRLVCFLEASIKDSVQWAVFEPNDERLWSSLRRDIGAFLTSQWRHGALKGATAAEAFYVQCDQTNQDSNQPGTVFCNIGIAPVRPAEFVQISIQQLTS
ncbi:phage tail sheath family protein [Streptomyces sp. NPDC051555]|uniref:phage tail sheath family protein n=1 Tax=Streptomyces sp. NPDC051555 TaxID=3365657 RepID=UPI0037B0FDEF